MQCMSDRFNRLEDDVDAARLQSVRVTGGTGNIFTNYHLFVLHADILHISSFMYVNPVVRRIQDIFHLKGAPMLCLYSMASSPGLGKY